MTDLTIVDPEILDDFGRPVPAVVVTLHDNIIIALRKAYPKWRDTWLIRIDQRGGIIQVYNTAFSGNMGFVMHITNLANYKDMSKIVKAAGELFERYGIARKKAIDIRQALADIKRNPLKEAIYQD